MSASASINQFESRTVAAAERVQLGRSELRVSPIAWGTWRLRSGDEAQARTLLHAALDAGIDLLDTADIYGYNGRDGFGDVEQVLGRVFAAEPGLRKRFVLASKGGIIPGVPYDSSITYLTAACEASLRRLGTDCIDLYQVHRPDLLTHPAELARALESLVASGKVRAVGVSNFTAAQTAALLAHCTIPLASMQPELSPLVLEPLHDGTIDLALQHGLGVLAWSPLAGGRLAAAAPADERCARVCSELDAHAERHGVTRAACVYSWLMSHPARVIPILGSQRPERLQDAAAARRVTWTRAEWYRVLVAARGAPLP